MRSANWAARTAERALEVGLRPVLVPSRLEDPAEKMRRLECRWAAVQGGRGFVEEADGVIYLAMSLRNVGSGIGVLQSWLAHGGRPEPDERVPTRSGSVARAAISSFRRVDPARQGR